MPSYPYYPQYYQQPNYQIPQNIQPSAPQQIQQPQIQNGGFVSVRSESEARNYPVAIGNSVTFKDETEPYVYTKTMGFSQLDRPIFEKYKLVKEEVEDESDSYIEHHTSPSGARTFSLNVEGWDGVIKTVFQSS